MSKWILKILSVLFLSLYIGVEYFHAFSIETYSPYAIYLFEIVWVFLISVLFRKIKWKGKFSFLDVALSLMLLPTGWAIHMLARQQSWIIPFDFNSQETILFLLLIGPVLEELVFRGALWRLLEAWSTKPMVLSSLTSLVFSYSHFQYIFSAPQEFSNFLTYQAAYTFVLALICSKIRMKSGVIGAMAAHLLFNLGFWLARV